MKISPQNINKRSRICELDLARGISMLFMFVFHYHFVISTIGTLIDAPYPLLVEASDAFFNKGIDDIFLALVFMFPLMSGITTTFSRSTRKAFVKAIKFAIVAAAISIGTYVASILLDTPILYIRFGIIHMLALSMAVYAVINLIITLVVKDSKHRRLTSAIAYAVLGSTIVIIGLALKFPLINSSYTNRFAFLGFTNWAFTSGDYFPVFPYTGYFLLGNALGTILYQRRQSLLPKLSTVIPLLPFVVIGRHALPFYISHIIGLFALVFALFVLPLYAFVLLLVLVVAMAMSAIIFAPIITKHIIHLIHRHT